MTPIRLTNMAVVAIAILILGTVTGLAQERAEKIDQRAKEISGMLTEKPLGVGVPITDRQAWDALREQFDVVAIIAGAERVMATTIPETPETLYMDFFETGNRDRYQRVRGQKYSRVGTLVLAECFENEGRFLPAIEESVKAICNDPSWVLPAHDTNGGIYKGEMNYIDLASSATSWDLATADYWLQDKLSPEVRQLIRENIECRTFDSYEKSVKQGLNPGRGNWWITTTNNWNSVCHAGVVGAALALIDDAERRAWYVASAELHNEFFLQGFTTDGYCSEGMGYWNYGFGNYVYMGETVLQATDGKVNFFAPPVIREIALFGPRMMIAPGIYAAFADCSPTARPDAAILKYLNRQLGMCLSDYTDTKLLGQSGTSSLPLFGLFGFPNTATHKPLDDGLPTATVLRDEFSDAGVLIGRAKDNDPSRLAFAIKAGHNNEHHNHNDVGSYVVTLGGATPLLDPGGEVYTQRTFSSRRYDSNVINSFGHPVPRINGTLQKTGGDAKGVVIAKSFADDEDMLAMDFSSAYPVEGLKQLTRTVFFNRTDDEANGVKHPGGQLMVIDKAELEQPGTFETALITFKNVVKITAADQAESFDLLVGDNAKEAVRVTVSFSDDINPLVLKYEMTEIDEDLGNRLKPKRLAFANATQAKSVEMVTVVTPVPEALIKKYFPDEEPK
ncbi:MAG: hypothetical protein FWH27_06285 [Planctomycetaceae bacterium]|nr:hypothetical protein [Planctomycetaceae bacterium]